MVDVSYTSRLHSNIPLTCFLASTANDFTSGGACKPFTLVFARGTGESGNMGTTVGPALQSGLTKKMAGKWAFQGLTYDASIANDFVLGTAGVMGTSSEADEAGSKLIDDIAAKCPDTKIIFSGYSQGAMVAHLSVQNAKSKGKVAVSGNKSHK
jgi:cutinase